jgi:hypothetical protein
MQAGRDASWRLPPLPQGGAGSADGSEPREVGGSARPAAVLGGVLLQERVLRAGLLWFKGRPDFYHRSSLRQAEEAHGAIQVGRVPLLVAVVVGGGGGGGRAACVLPSQACLPASLGPAA